MNHHNSTEQASYKRRINIIKGQMEGLQKMIEKGEYCPDILNQSLAIQNSLRSLDALIFEGHLKTHVAEQFQSGSDKAVGELTKLFKKVHNN